jgi:hypothetical protein
MDHSVTYPMHTSRFFACPGTRIAIYFRAEGRFSKVLRHCIRPPPVILLCLLFRFAHCCFCCRNELVVNRFNFMIFMERIAVVLFVPLTSACAYSYRDGYYIQRGSIERSLVPEIGHSPRVRGRQHSTHISLYK